MKKQVLFVATLLFATQLTTAQVLYSENFDNLTLGNVGTDFTGATPGQGGGILYHKPFQYQQMQIVNILELFWNLIKVKF